MSEIQWFTLIGAIIGLILEIRWAIRNKNCFLMAIPWILLFTHFIIFYAAWANDSTVIQYIDIKYSEWSSVLRGHSITTIVGYSIYRKNQRSCS